MTELTEVNRPWIYTYSGRKVDLFDPDPDTITLVDIAHSLSCIGRWGGHTTFYWSVAQHSIMVSKYCDAEDAMAGLFHDAAEAYFGDVARPLKRSPAFREYRLYYNQLETIILEKFCGVSNLPISVREADEKVLATEAVFLMRRSAGDIGSEEWLCDADPLDLKLQPASPEHAEQGFLLRYYRLAALNTGATP